MNIRSSTESEQRAHYDELIVRESLKHRKQRLQHERGQLTASAYGEHRMADGSDFSAEVASGSGSGIYQPAGSLHDHGYATITDRGNHAPATDSESTHLDIHTSRF
jgi:hypothetical protein